MLNYVSVRSDRYDPAAGSTVSDDPEILEARVQVYW
jgi:phosphate-selective porin OprO and OprP